MRNYTKIYDQADDLVQDSGECTLSFVAMQH